MRAKDSHRYDWRECFPNHQTQSRLGRLQVADRENFGGSLPESPVHSESCVPDESREIERTVSRRDEKSDSQASNTSSLSDRFTDLAICFTERLIVKPRRPKTYLFEPAENPVDDFFDG